LYNNTLKLLRVFDLHSFGISSSRKTISDMFISIKGDKKIEL
jgi:hypothetical protein